MTKSEITAVMDTLRESPYDLSEIILEFKCKEPIGVLGASMNRVNIVTKTYADSRATASILCIEDEMKPLVHIVSPDMVMQVTVSLMKSNKLINSVNRSIDSFFGMKDKDIITKEAKESSVKKATKTENKTSEAATSKGVKTSKK